MKMTNNKQFQSLAKKLKERFEYFHKSADDKEFFLGISRYFEPIRENQEFFKLVTDRIEKQKEIDLAPDFPGQEPCSEKYIEKAKGWTIWGAWIQLLGVTFATGTMDNELAGAAMRIRFSFEQHRCNAMISEMDDIINRIPHEPEFFVTADYKIYFQRFHNFMTDSLDELLEPESINGLISFNGKTLIGGISPYTPEDLILSILKVAWEHRFVISPNNEVEQNRTGDELGLGALEDLGIRTFTELQSKLEAFNRRSRLLKLPIRFVTKPKDKKFYLIIDYTKN